MKSKNFEFLRRHHAEVADLGGFAEQYVWPDPSSAMTKLRVFVELIVEDLYQEHRLPRPYSANLNDLLTEPAFRQCVPKVVQDKLHAVRIRGNKAAHGDVISTPEALVLLKDAFDVGQWFFLTACRGRRDQCPVYAAPPRPSNIDTPEQLRKEKAAVLEKLAAQEAQLQQVLADLEAERKHRETAEQVHAATRQELDDILAEGQRVANVLQFNEETTRRRLVDQLLVDAGWDVGAAGKSTEQVGQEVKVYGMPSPSGDGYADYVLWGDNGMPLAVVEAKRAAKDLMLGREQARIYATCLEEKFGVRPVIFYTNGIDIGIWDDAQKQPPRVIHGFYSKDSLEYLHFQRVNKSPLPALMPSTEIAGRMYQIEAVRRVLERFGDLHRKALVVQATGTGKTRVAISLCEALMRANWAKRILFLCDRKELRKQAKNVFKEFLPGEPHIVVSSQMTLEDRIKHRIFLATYPAMTECYVDFDAGFFDLIIADESHRSIYNKFRDLFLYFDALQVGLTATPVQLIERNTFQLFGCEDQNPTSNFTFQEALDHAPPYLVPFRVQTHTTHFLREGIKYSEMTDAQRSQLEADEEHPELIEFEASQVDRQIFNKDTNRQIIRNLMENGIRNATGMHPGKTIVFARSHDHAVLLEELFNETYPQYGGTFCRVIDNQEPKAEQLIDDFKDKDSPLTIAISVDMLDTGIDIHEVVNLVFAKPVKSYVKFWQMIGRGTRLCEDLFGPGQHKSEFLIFDHWGNFEFFSEKYVPKDPAVTKSLLQQLFEARMELADAAIDAMDEKSHQLAIGLLVQDLNDLRSTKSLTVKEHWKELESLADPGTLRLYAESTRADLLQTAAPLMKERNIRGHEDAYRFDLLVTQLQTAVLRGSARAKDLQAAVEREVALLLKNQTPVQAKKEAIEQVRSKDFWSHVSVQDLESTRQELRGIMRYKQQDNSRRARKPIVDLPDGDVRRDSYLPVLEGFELVAYRRRVEAVLHRHFADNETLQRIRAGKRVSESELEALVKLVLEVDDRANLRHLAAHSPDARNSLFHMLRGMVGLDATAVDAAFTAFVHARPLSAQQIRFLALLKNHITKNGGIDIDRLYEDPFITIHAEGIEGVFSSTDVNAILAIIAPFEWPKAPESIRA